MEERRITSILVAIAELRVEVRNLADKLDTLTDTTTKKVEDHERRLRLLEKTLYFGMGGLALLQLALRYFIP